MDKIFINYRRSTDASHAGRIYDQFETAFGKDDVFFDVDGIDPGSDFVQVLSDRVSGCGIFIAVIGKDWLSVLDEEGNQRISDHNDWVRVELETALQQNKRVIPVLVDGATMPRADRLPKELAPLARRNAARISHEQFRPDVQRLIQKIAEFRTIEDARRQEDAERAAAEELRRDEAERAAAREKQQREDSLKAAEAERHQALRQAAERERLQEETLKAAEEKRRHVEMCRAAEEGSLREGAQKIDQEERRTAAIRGTDETQRWRDKARQAQLEERQQKQAKDLKKLVLIIFLLLLLMLSAAIVRA